MIAQGLNFKLELEGEARLAGLFAAGWVVLVHMLMIYPCMLCSASVINYDFTQNNKMLIKLI